MSEGTPDLVQSQRHGYPAGGRLVAGLLSLLMATLATWSGANLAASGQLLTASTWVVTTAPFAAVLGAFALVPDATQRILGRFTRLHLQDSGHVFAFALLTVATFLIFGVGSLIAGAAGLESRLAGEPVTVPTGGNETTRLVSVTIQNLFLLVLPPVIWVTFVGDLPLRRAAAALGLHTRNAPRALGIGVATAFLALITIYVLSTLAMLAGYVPEENEVALAIGQSLSVWGAVALAAISSTTEEVFFRGLLTPRTGMWGSSILFAIAHLSYVNVLQIVVTFALGLGFAYLYRRTSNLWAPIAAHFTFNLIMLLAASLAPPS